MRGWVKTTDLSIHLERLGCSASKELCNGPVSNVTEEGLHDGRCDGVEVSLKLSFDEA